ncbi:MAG: SDR family oxidoreductase [Arthrobacter sp.]|nr:SDR family oxidoreductase [Arthrobacter sp.]
MSSDRVRPTFSAPQPPGAAGGAGGAAPAATAGSWPRLGRLDGVCALVTGAREGLGLATARALGERGARVLLGGRSAARLEPVVASLRAEGVDASSFAADVSVASELDAAFAAAAEAGDVPRILVNNVGVRDRRGVDTLDTAAFSALLGTDLVAAYDVTRRFLAAHGERPGGAIVTISSIAAVRGRAGDVGYAAAKAGLEGMTRSLASELGPRGYRVNAVAPGSIATESNAELMVDPRFSEVVRTRTALERWGRPEEIAAAVAFLASGEASYITGHTLVVDGGLSTLF